MIRTVVVAVAAGVVAVGAVFGGAPAQGELAPVAVAPVIGHSADGRVAVVDVSTDPSADITAEMLADCVRSVGGWSDPHDGGERMHVATDAYGMCAP